MTRRLKRNPLTGKLDPDGFYSAGGYVPLGSLSREQIAELEPDAFSPKEWGSLPDDLRDLILKEPALIARDRRVRAIVGYINDAARQAVDEAVAPRREGHPPVVPGNVTRRMESQFHDWLNLPRNADLVKAYIPVDELSARAERAGAPLTEMLYRLYVMLSTLPMTYDTYFKWDDEDHLNYIRVSDRIVFSFGYQAEFSLDVPGDDEEAVTAADEAGARGDVVGLYASFDGEGRVSGWAQAGVSFHAALRVSAVVRFMEQWIDDNATIPGFRFSSRNVEVPPGDFERKAAKQPRPAMPVVVRLPNDFYIAKLVTDTNERLIDRETVGGILRVPMATTKDKQSVAGMIADNYIRRVPDNADTYLLDEVAFALESVEMGHCVGQYKMGYIDAVRSGQIDIYSVRRPGGKPLFTIEVQRDSAGNPTNVEQIKGNSNRRPGFQRGGHETLSNKDFDFAEFQLAMLCLTELEDRNQAPPVQNDLFQVTDMQAGLLAVARMYIEGGNEKADEIYENDKGPSLMVHIEEVMRAIARIRWSEDGWRHDIRKRLKDKKDKFTDIGKPPRKLVRLVAGYGGRVDHEVTDAIFEHECNPNGVIDDDDEVDPDPPDLARNPARGSSCGHDSCGSGFCAPYRSHR